MTIWFGLPHAAGLVALSVVMAVFGGYVGLGLAAQARAATGLYRRGLLAGAAWSLGLGIWTMHFVGMLAARLPENTLYSVLLTLLSFLLCVLVVGIAAFIVSSQSWTRLWAALASLIMGSGIVGMHYLGMHAVTGDFMLHHDWRFTIASAVIALASSYWALRVFESEARPRALPLSALIFGLAVSGMHYTAMMGTVIMKTETTTGLGPSLSSDALMIVVAVLAFLVSSIFLLYLAPEARRLASAPADDAKPRKPASLVPVESDGATKMIPAASISVIKASTHYTLVHDGQREYFSPWSITEAEEQLDRESFIRVHRSNLVAIDKIRGLRRSGDGGVVEVGAPVTRVVPVSRKHYAELKSRLGLQQKMRQHATSQPLVGSAS